MSTKVSLMYQGDRFHLYHDLYDTLGEDKADPPVYLELTDCRFEAVAAEGASQVTVCIPADIARRLGILRTTAAEGSEA